MPESKIRLLIKFAWNHSIQAYYCELIGKVVCAIPCVHIETRVHSMELWACDNLAELKNILGY